MIIHTTEGKKQLYDHKDGVHIEDERIEGWIHTGIEQCKNSFSTTGFSQSIMSSGNTLVMVQFRNYKLELIIVTSDYKIYQNYGNKNN